MTTAAGNVVRQRDATTEDSGELPAAVHAPLAPPNPRIPLYRPSSYPYAGVSTVGAMYPEMPSTPEPATCDPLVLAVGGDDPVSLLARLRRVVWPW